MVTKFKINNEWCATAILLSCLPCRHLGSVGRYHWIRGNIFIQIKKSYDFNHLDHFVMWCVWRFGGLAVWPFIHDYNRSFLWVAISRSFILLWYFIIEFVFTPWINDIGSVTSARKFQNLMFQKVQSASYLCIKLSIK